MKIIENLFLCIGAQKAGTSWLFSVLKKDDRFSYCPFVKEIHYFDYIHCKSTHLNNWRAHYLLKLSQNRQKDLKPILSGWMSGKRKELLTDNKYKVNGKFLLSKRFSTLMNETNDEWYADLIKCNPIQRYSLDITPDYAVIGEKGFKHISTIANNIKLLFILRNPVERAWSGLLQGKKQLPGGIDNFLENGLKNKEAIFIQCTEGADVGARCNYIQTLKDIYAAGLNNNLKVKFYDDISNSAESFIDDVYNHIELDNNKMKTDEYIASLSQKVYETKKSNIPEWLEEKLKNYYRDMIVELIEEYKLTIPENWLNYFDLNKEF